MRTKGIDVSKCNGAIDWQKVAASGVEFALIRAGYGMGGVDEQFDRNIKSAIENGIKVGVYWFSYAWSVARARDEALSCIERIKGYMLDMPVFFDWEYDSYDYCIENKGILPTRKLINDMALMFMDTLQSAGYQTGNYTNPDYISKYYDYSGRLSTYHLWVASWTKTRPSAPSSNVWQFTVLGSAADVKKGNAQKIGSIRGVNGAIDVDYCYTDYGMCSPYSTDIYTVSGQSVKLRKAPKKNATLIKSLKVGSKLRVFAGTDTIIDGVTWVRARYNGYTGWCSKRFLTK